MGEQISSYFFRRRVTYVYDPGVSILRGFRIHMNTMVDFRSVADSVLSTSGWIIVEFRRVITFGPVRMGMEAEQDFDNLCFPFKTEDSPD